MTFSPAQRLTLWVGTLLCAASLFLSVSGLLVLSGWRPRALAAGCLIGAALLVLDMRGGAK